MWVRHPEVPPHHNVAKRAIQGPANNRYTRYESGSEEEAHLTWLA